MQAVKAKGSMKSLEADLLKTAAKEAKDNLVGKAANTMLISASYQEKDEKQLRDKLVTKLKQKAEDREVGLTIIGNWNPFITNQGDNSAS